MINPTDNSQDIVTVFAMTQRITFPIEIATQAVVRNIS